MGPTHNQVETLPRPLGPYPLVPKEQGGVGSLQRQVESLVRPLGPYPLVPREQGGVLPPLHHVVFPTALWIHILWSQPKGAGRIVGPSQHKIEPLPALLVLTPEICLV